MEDNDGKKRGSGHSRGTGKNRTFHQVGSFNLTFEQALAGINLAISRMSRDQYLAYMDRLAHQPPDQVQFGEPNEPIITSDMDSYFVRVRLADGFSYHLGVKVGDGIGLICGTPADTKDMEAISAKAGGVSCSECARRAGELRMPVAVQLEELPVTMNDYDNPANVAREAKRVDRETSERIMRLQTLFAAAGGAPGN